jgi:hypothetical protein
MAASRSRSTGKGHHAVSEERSDPSSFLKMEAEDFSEMLVPIYQTIQCHITGAHRLQFTTKLEDLSPDQKWVRCVTTPEQS